MNIFGSIASALKAALLSVTETFNRANGSLGTANGTISPTGNWATIRGSWGIVSNAANSATAASSYPLATLTFFNNSVTVGVDNVGPGAGTAFWVTDSGTWWGTYMDGTQVCQTCYNASTGYTCVAGYNASNAYSCINGYNTSNLYYCVTGYNASNPYSCVNGYTPGNAYSCVNYNASNPYTCVSGYNPPNFTTNTCNNLGYCYGGNPNYTTCYNPSNAVYGTCYNPDTPINGTCYNTSYAISGPCYNASNPNYTTCYNASNPNYTTCYNTSTPYSCNCTVATSVNLIKSIANTITTVATYTFASVIVGFKTLLNASTGVVTVRGYSGAGYTTQVGTDQSTTVTGATPTKQHGILLGPVTYSASQTANIDNFQAQ